MSSKSGLDIMGIPTLLQSIGNDRKTGTLKVQSGLAEKHVYFRSGSIAQVSSPQKPSILAEGLRRHPELDKDSYEAVCEEQRKTGKSLAALLLADEEDGLALVTAICQFQILEEICEIFTWENCHSEFTEGKPDPMLFDLEIMDIEPMESGPILLEAARREDEWKMIKKVIPSKKDIPYKKKEPEGDVSDEARLVLVLIDGFRDLEDILALVRLGPFVAMHSIAQLAEKEVVAFKTGKELLQIAKLDVFRENSHKRIRLYERAMELGETSREINLWLAHSYEAMGMRDKAGEQYREIGNVSLQNTLYPVAIRAFEKAVYLLPENLPSHECLVSLLAKTDQMGEYAERMTTYARRLSLENDRDRAILLLQEATEKYPKNPGNLDLLGSLYQECGYKREAVNIYRKLAGLQIESDKLEDAVETYHKIVLLDKENLEVRKNLGEILEKLGKNQDALDHYRAMGNSIYATPFLNDKQAVEYLIFVSQKITEKAPGDLQARQWLAEAYLAQNKNDKATEQFKEILQRMDQGKDMPLLVAILKNLVHLHPKELENRFNLGETYMKMKREREAVQEYFAAGVAAMEMDNVEKALEAFDLLLAIDPANFATRLKKADILVEEEKKEKAIEELVVTGYLSIGADKLWQAVKAFRHALTLNRDEVLCYRELGRLYQKLGKPRESGAAFKKHVQKSVKANNFGEALESCEAILNLEPGQEWAQKARQKINDAIPKIQKAFQS